MTSLIGLASSMPAFQIDQAVQASNQAQGPVYQAPIPENLLVPDELIVEIKQGTPYNRSVEIFQTVKSSSYDPIAMEAWLAKFSHEDFAQAASKLATFPEVLSIQRNFRLVQCSNVANPTAARANTNQLPAAADPLPKDPLLSSQWYLGAVRATKEQPKKTSFNGVVILDNGCTGIKKNQDLDILMANWDVENGNWRIGGGFPSEKHGTMLATTLGGKWNNYATAGLMKNPRIWSVEITKNGNGELTEAQLIKGLMWARSQVGNTAGYPWDCVVPLNVTPPYSLADAKLHPAFHHICKNIHDYMSGLIYLAAGNNGLVDQSPRTDYLNVVTACDQNGEILPSSNRGKCVTLMAPGKDIVCTDEDGNAVTASGTSFSAAIAAGVAGLIHNRGRELNKFLYNKDVDFLMKATCSMKPVSGWSQERGFGLPDYKAAVESMKN